MARKRHSARSRRTGGSDPRPAARPGSGRPRPAGRAADGPHSRRMTAPPRTPGSGVRPATRHLDGIAKGERPMRRPHGLSIAIKLGLAVAFLVTLIVGIWGWYLQGRLAASMMRSLKRNGGVGVVLLAQQAPPLLQAFNIMRSPRPEIGKLKDVLYFGSENVPSDVIEALILTPEVGGEAKLVASASLEEVGIISTEGEPERLEGSPSIRVSVGSIERGGRRLPAVQFEKAILDAEGKDLGSARLILSRAKVMAQLSAIKRIVIVSGLLFVLLGLVLAYAVSSTITQPVKMLVRDMEIVSRGDLDHTARARSADEIGVLAVTFNRMTKSLLEARELERQSERLASELNAAREIQATLLPARIPQIQGYDIYPVYRSAKEVSGDYYDFIPVDRAHLGFIVADVSGKGIPGSMVMASTRTVVRLVAAENPSAADVLIKANAIIARDIKRGMFITAIYGILNVRSRVLTVASAGHNPMVLFRERTGRCELVNPSGIALGFDKGPIFNRTIKEEKIQLARGDRVVLYTDGVVEAMSPKKEEFGEEQFCRLVREIARLDSRTFVSRVIAALDAHRGSAEQHDDITISTFRVS